MTTFQAYWYVCLAELRNFALLLAPMAALKAVSIAFWGFLHDSPADTATVLFWLGVAAGLLTFYLLRGDAPTEELGAEPRP